MGTGSLPPPYPVINGKPTLLAALRNFQLGDWGRMIFCTALGGVWGFAAGTLCAHRSLPPPFARFYGRCLLPLSLARAHVTASDAVSPLVRFGSRRRQAHSAARQHQHGNVGGPPLLRRLLPELVASAHRPAAQPARVRPRWHPLRARLRGPGAAGALATQLQTAAACVV